MNTQLNAIVAHEHIQDLFREAERARIARPSGVRR